MDLFIPTTKQYPTFIVQLGASKYIASTTHSTKYSKKIQPGCNNTHWKISIVFAKFCDGVHSKYTPSQGPGSQKNNWTVSMPWLIQYIYIYHHKDCNLTLFTVWQLSTQVPSNSQISPISPWRLQQHSPTEKRQRATVSAMALAILSTSLLQDDFMNVHVLQLEYDHIWNWCKNFRKRGCFGHYSMYLFSGVVDFQPCL